MNVRDTSKQSFDEIEPELSRQEAHVVSVLKLFGRRDWSLQEIESQVQLDIRATSRCVYDLKRKGAMFERSLRACSISGRKVNAVALRCFYVEEFETQRRARAAELAGALESEIERCSCACCERWRGKFKAALQQVQRNANPT